MIIPDANLLIYATNADAPQHEESRTWLARALGSTEPVGFAWTVLLAFLRIATKPQLFARPLSVTEALSVIDFWLAQPASVVVAPTERHAAVLRSLLLPLGTGGNLTSDAHLAALAIEHGAVVISYDNDFQRFAGLTWRGPGTSEE